MKYETYDELIRMVAEFRLEHPNLTEVSVYLNSSPGS